MKREVRNHLSLKVLDNYEEMSGLAADLIFDSIISDPKALICTATGASPTRTYDLLIRKCQQLPRAFDRIRIIKLDEWGGIPMEDPATCEVYLKKHLVGPLSIDDSRYISFHSQAQDPDQETRRVAQLLADQGAIDLCILGLGLNGHLGFNEPAASLTPHAHIAVLSETTKKHTMALSAESNIQYGLTLGMADIMCARKILLIVNGAHKKKALETFLSKQITTDFPATMLWMHSDVTLLCDKEAFQKGA